MPGNEAALLPGEDTNSRGRSVAAQRATGAGRLLARELLPMMGAPAQAVARSPSGAPVWPRGVTGSIAHDDEVAVAIVGPTRSYVSLGIDLEPAGLLPADLLMTVLTPGERRKGNPDDPLHGRILFSVKEAVYKAVQPIDLAFLEFEDVEVDLVAGTAVVQGRRVVPFRVSRGLRILTLAFIPAED